MRSRYDQFSSSKYVAFSRFKVSKRFREHSRIPVKQQERTLNKSRRKRRLLRAYVKKNVPSSSRIHQFTKKYSLYRDKHYGKNEDKQKLTSNATVKCKRKCCSTWLRKSKKMSGEISLWIIPNETSLWLHSRKNIYYHKCKQLRFLKPFVLKQIAAWRFWYLGLQTKLLSSFVFSWCLDRSDWSYLPSFFLFFAFYPSFFFNLPV